MAFTNNSPNMLLPVPEVGLEPGPQYASDVNNCLTIIDQHDHTPNHGVQISPAGLDINSDLTFSNNNAINMRSVRFQAQSAALALPSDLDCVYVSGVDLYYNDGNGNQVRITQSGGVAGTPGSISNLTSPASAAYVAANSTFVWESDTNTSANLDCASVVLRNLSASSFGLTLSPPNAMGADYSITLPSLPASTAIVTMDTSGALASNTTYTATVNQGINPSGALVMYAGSSVPLGYLLCDGSAVSRATYAALFSAIGTAYGVGNGSTTFNIPDLRGLFARGVSGLSGNDPDASSRTATNGGNSGNNVGSVQADALASHVHTQNAFQGAGGATGFGLAGAPQLGTLSTGATGGNETRPKNVYVNFIIKT